MQTTRDIALMDEAVEPLEEARLGTLKTPNGNLPLKAVSVLEQTFKNCLKEAVEATYIFPLPTNAGVTSFTMRVGERVVEGVLEDARKPASGTMRRYGGAIVPPSPSRSDRTCSACGWAT